MRVAIHQPHFFPWMGYMDKMAKADVFVILDAVQLEDRSPMLRNKMIDYHGDSRYISVHANKSHYRDKPCREIQLDYADDWNISTLKFLSLNYKRAAFFEEIFPSIEELLRPHYRYLIELQMLSVSLFRGWLQIGTPMIMQSELDYDQNARKSQLMLALTQSAGGNCYLSGQGARKYMEDSLFQSAGIELQYQQFTQPIYEQCNSQSFVPGLSLLDMFLNCGKDKTKEIFWGNMECQIDRR